MKMRGRPERRAALSLSKSLAALASAGAQQVVGLGAVWGCILSKKGVQ